LRPKATSDDTKFVRTASSNAEGTCALVNLPHRHLYLTFALEGFSAERKFLF